VGLLSSSEKHRVLSARRRGLASERIAISILEELGYRVLEVGKKIIINGTEIGEVDVLAEDQSGEKYAVEVKAGRLDVGGVRQAYVNALILGAKPMVICKGFADDAARELAEKLGVRVVQLSDVFLVESEELYSIVREVVEEVLTEYFELFYGYTAHLKPEHYEILSAIYSSTSIEEAAEKLNLDVSALAKHIDELRKQGVIPKWASKYSSVKRVAQILVQKQSVVSALEESRKLVESLKSLVDQLKALQGALHTLTQQLARTQQVLASLEKHAEKSTQERALSN
jgi:predicted RecB family endonuclease